MKRHHLFVIVLLGVVLTIARTPAAASGDLDSAKALYASASYEEALATLNGLQEGGPAANDPIQVNQYRALCLLALGRVKEAEEPLRQMVSTNPLYVLPADEVSPKLVDLFREVRRQVLPDAARELYSEAKANYDAKKAAEAAIQFKTLLSLLNDPDTRGVSAAADLKVLAEGFLALAEAQIAPPPAPAPAAGAAARGTGSLNEAGSASASAADEQPRQVIFTNDDSDVRPPVERSRPMPQWRPVTLVDRQTVRRGVLQIVVDEEGSVETANLVTPISPAFDEELVRVAKTWRYNPATRQGVPVKYSMALEIILRPTAASARE
jgi:TonB family protein